MTLIFTYNVLGTDQIKQSQYIFIITYNIYYNKEYDRKHFHTKQP